MSERARRDQIWTDCRGRRADHGPWTDVAYIHDDPVGPSPNPEVALMLVRNHAVARIATWLALAGIVAVLAAVALQVIRIVS